MTSDVDVTRESGDANHVFKREWIEAAQDLSRVRPDSIVMISDTEAITGAEWLRRHQWWSIIIATFGLIGLYNGHPQFQEFRRDMMARCGVTS